MANIGKPRAKGAKAYQGQQIVDRNTLVIKYAPLVKRMALHLRARLPRSVEVDDLIQSGMIGLIEAIHNYKDNQGAVFESYAAIRIKGAMIDDLRHCDWTPRGVHQNTRAIREASARLAHRYGRPPTNAEIAADLKIDIDRFNQMLLDTNAAQVTAIEDLGVSEDVISGALGEHNEDHLFEMIDSIQFKTALQEAIEELPERERRIVSFYYLQELNLREIGLILGISESRTCQVMSQALVRVREKLAEWDSEEGSTDEEEEREYWEKRPVPIAPGAKAIKKPESEEHQPSLLFDENGEISMRTAKGAEAAMARALAKKNAITSQAVRTTADGVTTIEAVGDAPGAAAESAPRRRVKTNSKIVVNPAKDAAKAARAQAAAEKKARPVVMTPAKAAEEAAKAKAAEIAERMEKAKEMAKNIQVKFVDDGRPVMNDVDGKALAARIKADIIANRHI